MHHKISGRKFNRRTSQRMALLNSLARSLLNYEKIITTLPKAKDICPYVEKMLTLGKHGSIADRRQLFAKIRDNNLVSKVFGTLAERYRDRQGGYTRIFKCGFRKGDMAPIAVVELVDSDKSLSIAAQAPLDSAVESSLNAKEMLEENTKEQKASSETSAEYQDLELSQEGATTENPIEAKPSKKTHSRKKDQ